MAVFLINVLAYFWLYDLVAPTNATERADFVRTFAQIAGGIILALGLFATIRNVEINREGQITERFTRAIDQLGAVADDKSPKIEIRLGAIYALERIARDSERDHGPIVEILTAYVGENSPWPPRDPEHLTVTYVGVPARRVPPLRTDIQAVLTVLGRRRNWGNEGVLVFSGTDLRGYDLAGARLRGAWFIHSNLAGANVAGADLRESSFVSTDLRGVDLGAAKLNRSMFLDSPRDQEGP